MFRAACDGDVGRVRFHLENGVDADHSHPEFQSTVLVASILAGQRQVAHLLLDHGANPLLVSELEGQTPVQAAHQAGFEDVVARLRALGAPDPGPAPQPRGGWLRRLWRRVR